ncbi:MAG: alpha/beta hydrolase [Burkholderiaceae bacterium]
MKLPAERAVKVGGLTWHVIETRASRDAPVLVMLPGTLGTAVIFADVMQALGPRVRLLSVSYPMIEDIERLADSLGALMTGLGIERASVVGSSLGGFLAQHFAARHPERVDRLILGNTFHDPALTRRVTGRQPVDSLRAQPPRMHRDMVVNSVKTWPETDPLTRKLKTLLIDSGTRLLSARAMKARVLAVQAGPAVPRLKIGDDRITIIDCEDDPLLPRSVQDSVVRRYPGARHVRLDSGGHYPYVVRMQDYVATLEQALGIA